MAEFQEVMRQWVRARKATASSAEENVLLLSVYTLEKYDDALIANIEKNVMRWAAEHPEPVYPTWWDYLCMIGIIPDPLGDKTLGEVTVERLMRINISADIAEKLGIEPKEGTT